ncbi:FAD binding domain-containing protein [Ditylenchus destructor]|uniref:Ubiquinone biosynthesis monooxygenase COQ6, mitochondrial n=1 Tax=Ditylenchus destructor TaxID=166010 RepID=A0AAD4RAD5_9BILA|nr:FAD binding domain-containing protein [Ditylenchus destructor]
MLLRQGICLHRCFSSAHNTSFYDVVIVGGGLVGNAMACSLGKSPVLKSQKVLLLESGKPKSLGLPPTTYSNRVSAVSPASVRLFEKLGVWEKLKEYRVKSVTDLYVMDSCSESSIRFEQPNPRKPIAYMVENEAIISVLYDQITSACSNVTVKTESKVASCSLPEDLSDTAEVSLSDGSVIKASLVIGADGMKSCVRQSMGVDIHSHDYEQMAIVCTLQVSLNNHSGIAWQRFTPLGPIALLPLSNDLCSLVWTTSTDDARRLLNLPVEEFVAELGHYIFTDSSQNSLTNSSLRAIDKIFGLLPFRPPTKPKLQPPHIDRLQFGSKREAFPLAYSYARDYVTSRAALIGDAAHRIHPLAGQGVNLGWFDVATLTSQLENAVREGADIGSLTYLREYDTQSQRHNSPVQAAVDALNRLYRTDFGPMVFLRSIGLHSLDKLLPVKDLIVYRASM